MDLLKSITSAIETFLNANPSCTEHEIIKHLQQNEIEPFGQFNLRVNTDLFSAHFLTKHCLYSLQNSLLQAQRFCLSINSVAVNLTPYNSGLAATMHYDSVKSYYLDISHYFETSEQEVNELLKKIESQPAITVGEEFGGLAYSLYICCDIDSVIYTPDGRVIYQSK